MPDVQVVFRMSTQKVHQDPGAMERQHTKQRKAERDRKIGAIAVVTAIVGLGGWLAVRQLEPAAQVADPVPTDEAQGLGIFAPFTGRIVYVCAGGTCSGFEGAGLWGINPDATEPEPRMLPNVLGKPVAWSEEGTELLLIRHGDGGDLVLLHADGTETLLPSPTLSEREVFLLYAAMSSDGSMVTYTAPTEDGFALSRIDVATGHATVLVESQDTMLYQPTFSPDGTQIAYIDGGGDHSHRVWVVNADGTDPHMIVENDVTSQGHVFGLAWSPTRDRIALGLRRLPVAGIYTFAPNGSDFRRVIRDAISPSWSPDGSQIAFESLVMLPCPEDPSNCWTEDTSGGLGIVDADGKHVHTFEIGGSGPWHPA